MRTPQPATPPRPRTTTVKPKRRTGTAATSSTFLRDGNHMIALRCVRQAWQVTADHVVLELSANQVHHLWGRSAMEAWAVLLAHRAKAVR
jgi:hypothetical protein